jgi:hypothetical protein
MLFTLRLSADEFRISTEGDSSREFYLTFFTIFHNLLPIQIKNFLYITFGMWN